MKKLLLVLTLFFSTYDSKAQSFNLVHDHSTIQVKNISKSVEFYISILQLKEVVTPWPDNKMIRFFETGKNQLLHIAQADIDVFGEVSVNKVLHLAFAVNNFDEFLKYLKGKGVDYSNFNEERNKIQIRPDEVRQIYFQDPDGYWIEINDAKH